MEWYHIGLAIAGIGTLYLLFDIMTSPDSTTKKNVDAMKYHSHNIRRSYTTGEVTDRTGMPVNSQGEDIYTGEPRLSGIRGWY